MSRPDDAKYYLTPAEVSARLDRGDAVLFYDHDVLTRIQFWRHQGLVAQQYSSRHTGDGWGHEFPMHLEPPLYRCFEPLVTCSEGHRINNRSDGLCDICDSQDS